MAKDSIEKSKEIFLKQLKTSKGIIAPACKKANISRTTYYRWMENDPNFKEEVNNIFEESIDHVESKMHRRINEGSDRMIIFYLETKGKDRGYSKKSELEIQTSELSIDEIKEELSQLQKILDANN